MANAKGSKSLMIRPDELDELDRLLDIVLTTLSHSEMMDMHFRGLDISALIRIHTRVINRLEKEQGPRHKEWTEQQGYKRLPVRGWKVKGGRYE
tara:strand:+ start:460 stop:741 length:282 start_codon:yes stop_codon:yes gene_type:complete